MRTTQLLMILNSSEEDEKNYAQVISSDDCQRRDRRVPQIAICRYHQSPFYYVYDSGNNQSLLNCTGYDHEKFALLLHKFGRKYDEYTFDEKVMIIRLKKKSMFFGKGRPRELDAIGGLGLVLIWYRTRGSCARSLALHFGLTSTPLYKWLKFARAILLSVLIHDPQSQIVKPSLDEVTFYRQCIGEIYPSCEDV